jgi:hypothetical protein
MQLLLFVHVFIVVAVTGSSHVLGSLLVLSIVVIAAVVLIVIASVLDTSAAPDLVI